jgi:ABC-type Fe3+ transport system permease subunit
VEQSVEQEAGIEQEEVVVDRAWWLDQYRRGTYTLIGLSGFTLAVFSERNEHGHAMFFAGVLLVMASLLLWSSERFPAPRGGMPIADSMAHRVGLRHEHTEAEIDAILRYTWRIFVQAAIVAVAVAVVVQYLVVRSGFPGWTHWVNVATLLATITAWIRRKTRHRRPRPTLS